ncbi:IQ calmodulin-binding motif-containing protein 1 [Merluccius polli]|uniref:IQ calmodulin-binding motif-containing protein 1 n=1 Tax=Merluccius polli TaxID=89951 RepID=A0AA47M080_MERPO|nr:IQ calmodulin-binding motif-containing protein 1 [Merluccius polli]
MYDSSCCVGAEPDKDHKAFYTFFLPSVMEGLLSLACRLMSQVAEVTFYLSDYLSRTECVSLYRSVMGSVGWLLGVYSCLIPQVLSCLYYERMQMCDDVIISLVCVSMWSQICSTSRDFLSGLSDDSVLLLINDAVGQLAVSSDAAVGRACIGLLVLIANQLDRERHALLHTFTGLDRLLNKDWRRRGFNKEIDQLITILNSDWPTAKHTHTQALCERVRAAYVIQAAWRGHVTRNRMKNLLRAVGILQRKYREKVRQRMLLEQTSRWEAELRYQVYVRRQQARRNFHQKQKQLLHLLPPELVQRYQHQLEGFAAVAIQRWWRGHRERRSFHTLYHAHTQHRAACTLQRVVLNFLKKRRGLQAPPTSFMLISQMGLTDRQRAELNKEVEHYVHHHPSCVVSLQGCEQLFLQTQTLLLQHNTHLEQHTHALLAHINTQLDLLEDAPSICVATTTDVDVFHSRLGPGGGLAQQSHDAFLHASRLPGGRSWITMMTSLPLQVPLPRRAKSWLKLQTEGRNLRRERIIIIRPRLDVLSFPDEYLFERFHFSASSIIYLKQYSQPLTFFLYNIGDAEHVSKATCLSGCPNETLALKRLLLHG